MGGPRKATAPKVTTTPAPETAVFPDPVTTDTPVPVVPVEGTDAQTPAPGADGTASADRSAPDPATPDPVTPDPVTPDTTPTPEPAPAAPTSPDTAVAAVPAAEPVDTTEIVMNIAITGTVDGESWPAPGGAIALPTAEAERYVRLGYAHFPEK